MPQPESLEKYYHSLNPERQSQLLYALDYILSYKRGWRYAPNLSEMGYGNYLQELKKANIVESFVETDYNRNSYQALKITEDYKTTVKTLVENNYHPNFTDSEVMSRLLEIISRNRNEALLLLWELRTSAPEDPELRIYDRTAKREDLISDLAREGLAFPVEYTSSKGTFHYKVIVFRDKPLAIKVIFLELLEAELDRYLMDLSDPEKWCLYLKSVNPSADQDFYVTNRAENSRDEILSAYHKMQPDTYRTPEPNPILKVIQDRLDGKIRQLFVRDLKYLLTLATIFQLADLEDSIFKLSEEKIIKLREISSEKASELTSYLEDLKSQGILLQNNSDYWIPTQVRKSFDQEIQGNILNVKFFTSRMDAEEFFENLFGRASSIRIWDPYYTRETLTLIMRGLSHMGRSENKVSVEILTSCPSGEAKWDPVTTEKELKELQRKADVQMKAIFKVYAKKDKEKYASPFHDRYVIIDRHQVWVIGSSLGFIGQKNEIASQLNIKAGSILNAAFEGYWKRDWGEEWTVMPFVNHSR